jgi:hypothetical protein
MNQPIALTFPELSWMTMVTGSVVIRVGYWTLCWEVGAEMNETEKLKSLLYDAILELGYIQEVENCHSGLCATSNGKDIVDRGIALLGVEDLSGENWHTAKLAIAKAEAGSEGK